jgi:hypothetical protein
VGAQEITLGASGNYGFGYYMAVEGKPSNTEMVVL